MPNALKKLALIFSFFLLFIGLLWAAEALIYWQKPYDAMDGISDRRAFVVLIDMGDRTLIDFYYPETRCYRSAGPHLLQGNVEQDEIGRDRRGTAVSVARQDGSSMVTFRHDQNIYEYEVRDNCATPLRKKVFANSDLSHAAVLALAVEIILGLALRYYLRLRRGMLNRGK